MDVQITLYFIVWSLHVPRHIYVSQKSNHQLISWSIHDIFIDFFIYCQTKTTPQDFMTCLLWSSSTRALVARFRGIPLLAVFHGRFHGIPQLEGESHFKRLCTWRSRDHNKVEQTWHKILWSCFGLAADKEIVEYVMNTSRNQLKVRFLWNINVAL